MNNEKSMTEESNLNSNFWNWFGKSKVVDEQGKPLAVYHGTQRPDRVGNQFDPKRASSGPMGFFTSDPSVASGYATSKRDTSIKDETEYYERFLVKVKGRKNPVNIVDYWYFLSPEQKKDITEKAPYVNMDMDEDTIFLDTKEGMKPFDSFQWDVRQARGNVFKALSDTWLASGSIFDEEERFLDVLRLLGITNVDYEDPHVVKSGVYAVYLSLQNPLKTWEVSDDVIFSLYEVSKKQRQRQTVGADDWDKRIQNPKEWVQRLKNKDDYVWTSIPDWVTLTLKQLGYDGIIDIGSKNGQKTEHFVYIPFRPNQIKSIWNKGTWSFDSNKLNEIVYQDAFGPEFEKFHKKWKGQKKDRTLFVQFTNFDAGYDNKVGYSDPNHSDPKGVYGYPLWYVIDHPGDIWYGANAKFLRVLQNTHPEKTLQLTYSRELPNRHRCSSSPFRENTQKDLTGMTSGESLLYGLLMNRTGCYKKWGIGL